MPEFVAILRAKHPRTPIIVTSPYYNSSEDMPGDAGSRQLEKRDFARKFVAQARAEGDVQIFLADGLAMIPRERADALADGRHVNSLGSYLCARGLHPVLRAALGLPATTER